MNHTETLDAIAAPRSLDVSGAVAGDPVQITCQWLHEGVGNRLDATLGRRVNLHDGPLDPLVLLLANVAEADRASLASALAGYDSWLRLPRNARRRIQSALHPVRDASDWQALVTAIDALTRFRDRVADGIARLWSPYGVGQGGAPRIQLDLPVLDKKHWRRRADILRDCRIETGHSGRIAALPAGLPRADCFLEQQTAIAIGAGLLDGCGDFHLSFSDQRVVPRMTIPMTLAPLLNTYGAATPVLPEEWSDVRVSVCVRTPGTAARAWVRAPKERTVNRYAAFSAMSQQTLRSLRAWMPYLHFANPGFFNDRDFAYAMLTYQAGKPYFRKGRPEYAYDPMVQSSVNLACRNVRPRLARILETVHPLLQAAGLTETAPAYKPDRAARIINAVKVGNRRFLTLLALDGLVMDRFDKLGNACRQQRRDVEDSSGDGPRYLLRQVHEVNRTFQGRLRRLSPLEDLSWLGALLTIEATAALSTHFGEPAPVEISVHLNDAASPQSSRPVVVRASRLPPGPPH